MKQHRNWFWGIILLLAGVLVVVAQFTSFATLSFWTIIIGVLLAAVLIQSIARMNWTMAFLAVALLYIVFQKPLNLFYIAPWLLILAAVLVGVGLSMLIRPRPRREEWGHLPPWQNPEGYPQNDGANAAFSADANGDDNHPFLEVSFGATNRYLHSTALENGHFAVNFGSAEVFFDQAQLAPGGASLNIECSFGSVKLYLPHNWNVRDDIRASIGGVENNTRNARPDPALPTLTLTGNVSFGAVEITYI